MMSDKYTDILIGISNGRNVLIFLVPSLVVYLVMLFHTIPAVQSFAPAMKVFDLMPGGYSHEYAVALLSELGPAGRDAYLFKQLPLDFIYPALFSISSCLLLAWVFLKREVGNPKLFYLCYVPLFAGFFDYMENIQIITMIFNYPDISSVQVALASVTTIFKSGLTTLFFILLIVAVIRLWSGRKNV